MGSYIKWDYFISDDFLIHLSVLIVMVNTTLALSA
jgi:hypothetical protein